MNKGTTLTAGLNRSQMALLNFLIWKHEPDENDHTQVHPLIGDIIAYTKYKNLLKVAKSSNDPVGEPIIG